MGDLDGLRDYERSSYQPALGLGLGVQAALMFYSHNLALGFLRSALVSTFGGNNTVEEIAKVITGQNWRPHSWPWDNS